jgi:hypothetical protein
VSKRFIILYLLAAVVSAQAQAPLRPDIQAHVKELFDGKPSGQPLRCSIHQTPVVLDFLFRFDAGYMVDCRLRQFKPGASLVSYLKIQPQEGPPVLLGDSFEIPPVSAEMVAKLGQRKVNDLEIELSGAYALGEGKYTIDLILIDDQSRSIRKRWNIETIQKRPDQSIPFALQPNTADSLVASSWQGNHTGNGVRLTVLLHATPMNPKRSKLYAWDRAFLLQSLTSLLKQTPYQSVRVIAFNLDQQQEIFRQDDFDAEGFSKLATVLRTLELGTVSYKAMQKQSWAGPLVRLTEEEVSSKNPSDAVIFLGPTTHFMDKVSLETMKSAKDGPHFFYFEYYPWNGSQFPDSIDHMTHDLHGTVFRIHSADQLAQAIQKMLGQIKPGS